MINTSAAILLSTAGVILGTLAFSRLRRVMSPSLKVDDRIRLSGGYDEPAAWLGTRPYVEGRVIAFVSASADKLAAIVRLDEPLSFENLTSDVVLLHLRYGDAKWNRREVVHVELWSDVPQINNITAALGGDRVWIESHAMYEVLQVGEH